MKKLNAEGSIVRSYSAGELPAGSYRAYFKGDFNSINSATSNGFSTLPATYQIGSSDTKKTIIKEQLDTSRDGWNYAVDEDRTFWKDDFSSNTSANYTKVGNPVFNIGNVSLSSAEQIIRSIDNKYGIYSIKVKFDGSSAEAGIISMPLRTDRGLSFNIMQGSTYFEIGCYDYVNSIQVVNYISTSVAKDFKEHIFGVEYIQDGYNILFDGVIIGTKISLSIIGNRTINAIGVRNNTYLGKGICYSIGFIPSLSYSDSLTGDTSVRYQAISGTNAYNSTKLDLTATAGNWNKTRLKSYKFESGRTTEKITLPATGHEGDIACCYISGSADMTTNYGVGVRRLSTNLWLPVEIKDNTVITVGTSSVAPIQDSDTVVLEVETDMIAGVSWLNVWNDGNKNIMTFPYDSSKYVSCGTNYSANTVFSIFIKFRTNSSCGRYGTIISNGDFSTNVGGFALSYNDRQSNKKICFYLDNYAANKRIVSTNELSDDVWNTACITYSSGVMKLYINGAYDTTANQTLTTNTNALLLGKTSFGSTSVYSGEICSVIIYNTLLTDFDVKNIHKGILVSNTVGHYVNTGNTNADWIDRSGNGNNGTVSGTPATIAITGSKVQGTTLKQFAPYQYGYSGVGYYNVYTSDNICSLKLLESRARSLIGYTNVPTTETLVFNDDFNVDSRNSYVNPTVWNYTVGSGLQNIDTNTMFTKGIYGKQITELYFTPSVADTVPACRAMIVFCSQDTLTGNPYGVGNRYLVYTRPEVNLVNIMKVTTTGGTTTYSTVYPSSVAFNFTLGTQYKIKLDYDPSLSTDKIKVYIAAAASNYPSTPTMVYNDSTWTSGYTGIGYNCNYSLGGRLTIQKFSINATRQTYKPMLRGAGVGSYYDGTQEIQTARFTDDLEYGSTDNALTYSSSYWEILDNRLHKKLSTNFGYLAINASKFANGNFKYKWTPIGNATSTVNSTLFPIFCCDSISLGNPLDNSSLTNKLYYIYMGTGSNTITIFKRDGSSTRVTIATLTSSITPTIGNTYNIEINYVNGVINLYINNVFIGSGTDTTPLSAGYCGFACSYYTDPTGHECYVKDISINAIPDTSTQRLLGGVQYGGLLLSDNNPVNTGNWAGFKFKNHDTNGVYTSTLNRGACTVASDANSYKIIRSNIKDSRVISSKAIEENITVTNSAATISTNDVTLDTDDANDNIGIYVQTRTDTAPLLPIVSQSLVNNTLTGTTSNGYYYTDFNVGSGALDVGVWETGTPTDNCWKMDYMLVVPKGLIEREAKRALLDLGESYSVVTE